MKQTKIFIASILLMAVLFVNPVCGLKADAASITDPDAIAEYQQESLQYAAVSEAVRATIMVTGDPKVDLANQTKSFSWPGTTLTFLSGINYGPSGKESYYSLDMTKTAATLNARGFQGEYWIRNDGVRMFGNYCMVAANWNVYPYGSLIETSLGTGIVCDTGSFATQNPLMIDIAVNW